MPRPCQALLPTSPCSFQQPQGFGQTQRALKCSTHLAPGPKLTRPSGSASAPLTIPHPTHTMSPTLLATFRSPSFLGLQLPCPSPYLPQGVSISHFFAPRPAGPAPLLPTPSPLPPLFPLNSRNFPKQPYSQTQHLVPILILPLSRPTFLKPIYYQGPAPLCSQAPGLSP